MRTLHKIISVFFLLLLICLFSACSEGVPVLTGEWVEVLSDADMQLTAVIEENTVEVYWVSEESESRNLYWAGSFVPPEEEGTYTWVSDNNVDKTSKSVFASGEGSKSFCYNKGLLSFDVTAFGETRTVSMERVELESDTE